MDSARFEEIAAEEYARVPERFARRVKNVALLIEEEPSLELCAQEGLGEGETLLGLYRGIPASERGDFYSGVLPDTITLFRAPLMEEARELARARRAQGEEEAVRLAIKETLWHEIGHYFGMSEAEIHAREDEGTNRYA